MKIVRTVSEADMARLKQARHEADARYNEALTALDAAIQALPAVPGPPPAPDEAQIAPLNERWQVTRALPAPRGGWRGRLGRFVMGLLRPAFDQQQAFNSAIVDHINRNAATQRAVPEVLAGVIDALRQQVEHFTFFQSRLIAYVQQLTPYVDTKDYEFAGLATRINEDVAEAHGQLADTVRGLAAALDAVSDDTLRKWERYEGLRSSLGTLQVAVHALRRELAQPGAPADTAGRVPAPSVSAADEASPRASARPAPSQADPLSSHRYVAFENVFRGDPALIRERQSEYVSLFRGRADVLDVGCGRGEFLGLLREEGISARGVDLNHEMVAECRAAGLDVTEGDALGYLRRLPDGALGGLIAAQVVEHLEPDYLMAFLDEAFRVLRPGSPIALETINVQSWSAFFSSYLRDLTHVRPIHPETLAFLVNASGFLEGRIEYRSPVPEAARLEPAPASVLLGIDEHTTGPEGLALRDLGAAFERNVQRLNEQLYGPLDYAVVAWRP